MNKGKPKLAFSVFDALALFARHPFAFGFYARQQHVDTRRQQRHKQVAQQALRALHKPVSQNRASTEPML